MGISRRANTNEEKIKGKKERKMRMRDTNNERK